MNTFIKFHLLVGNGVNYTSVLYLLSIFVADIDPFIHQRRYILVKALL